MKIVPLIVTGMILGMTSPLLSAEVNAPIILDVRTAQEYAQGHLEGAVLVPYDRISAQIATVVKSKTQKIYLYCRSGRRSKIAQNTLNTLGYTNIVDLGSMPDAAKALNRKIVVNER